MKQRVFITGGASGLGRALAQELTHRGAQVLIGDVDLAKAEMTAQAIGAVAVPCDVTKTEDLQKAANWMQDNWGGVDLVINNAGVAQMGEIAQSRIEDWQWILDINVLGIVRSCQTFGPIMKPGAQMLNIASMAALLYLPGTTAYSASKAAVLAISESLMLEWEPRGVSVHVACPAFFRTELAQNMRAADAQTQRVTTRLVERARLGADDVAQAILNGLDRGDPHIFTHENSKRSWLVKRFLPFGRYLKMMRKQLAQMNKRMARPEKSGD